MNLFSKEFWMRHEAIALFLILSVAFLAILGIAYLICRAYFTPKILFIVDFVILSIIALYENAVLAEFNKMENPFWGKIALVLSTNVAFLFAFITLVILFKKPIDCVDVAIAIALWNVLSRPIHFLTILK
jgi:uncharacterized membrane protein